MKTLTFFFLVSAAALVLFLFSVPHAHAGVISRPPPNLGLVAYWSFNEGTSTQAGDFSGNGNSGILTNMEQSDWVPGKQGKALEFDGGNDFVDMKDPSSLFAPNDLTFSLWFKIRRNVSDSGNYLLSDYNAAGTRSTISARIANGNTFRWFYENAAGPFQQIDGTSSVNLNTWYHLAGVLRGTTQEIYVNGVRENSGTVSGTRTDHGGNFTVGRAGSFDGAYFDGLIDEVRIYNRALSAKEVESLFKSGAAAYKTPSNLGLTGYWNFNEGTGTIVADSSGNRRHGITTNIANPPTSESGWANGRFGKGMWFDSIDDTVGTNLAASNFITASEGTLSAWMRPGDVQHDGASGVWNDPLIIGQDVAAGGYFGIHIDPTSISFYNFDTTPAATVVTTPWKAWTWTHVVWVHTGGVLYGYKDGALVGSTASANTASVADKVSMGGIINEPAGKEFWGIIDEVRTFNRGLSAAEVKALYQGSTFTSINSSQNSKLTTGLVGLWSFNGPDMNPTHSTARKAYDRSGSGNDGILTNGPVATIGKVGQALEFDGSDDYVDMVASSRYSFERTDSFSLAAWVKRSSDDTFDPIFGKLSSDGLFTGYVLQFINPCCGNIRSIGFDLSNTSSGGGIRIRVSTAADAIQNNQWYHIGATYDGSSSASGVKIYINGVSQSLTTLSDNLTATIINTNPLRIGADSSDSPDFHHGLIDEVRIYNRALNVSEVKQLYNLGR